MADIGRGTVAVIGHGRNDDRNAARRIAFVLNLFVIDVAQFARRLGDGALDVFVGHIAGLGLRDYVAELAVDGRVAAAVAHRDGDFTADLRKDFAALGVRLALFVLDICPLGMA